jgi:hypothetical protein
MINRSFIVLGLAISFLVWILYHIFIKKDFRQNLNSFYFGLFFFGVWALIYWAILG